MKLADFTSTTKTPLNLRVTYSSAIDLLCALWIIGSKGDHALEDNELGDQWFTDLEASLTPSTREDLGLIGNGDAWIALIPVLPEAGEGATIAEFIEFLAEIDPADLRYRLITVYDVFDESHRELMADAAEGNAEAIEVLLGVEGLSTPEMKKWRGSLQYLLGLDPVDTRELIVGVLRRVQDEAFSKIEEEFRPYLEADFRSKRSMQRRVSPERLLEVATSGVNFSDEHARRPIVLMPTMVARPWVVVAARSDFFVLGYPVADEHLEADGDAPPQWLVKLHRALGDERRLRVLRTLAQGDASLGELAETVDIAKSTLHHHLMLLRAAGLVRVQVGEDKRYSLRSDTFGDAAAMLDCYINATTDKEETTS
ncbi:MAG: winged helix-turn-helix domain-containing protein [Acidimicrobiia bacterium]